MDDTFIKRQIKEAVERVAIEHQSEVIGTLEIGDRLYRVHATPCGNIVAARTTVSRLEESPSARI